MTDMTDTMAIRIHELGGPEMMRWEQVPLPEPGPARCSSATRRSG